MVKSKLQSFTLFVLLLGTLAAFSHVISVEVDLKGRVEVTKYKNGFDEEAAARKAGLGFRLLPASEEDAATASRTKFALKFERIRNDKRALINASSIFSDTSKKLELEAKRRKINTTVVRIAKETTTDALTLRKEVTEAYPVKSEGRAVGDDITSLHAGIKEGTKWLFNKAKGKILMPLVEFLKEHNLPKGIFPRHATHYEFNENTKELVVLIPSVCEVGYSDSYVLPFNTTLKGFLEIGKLADIEGMKTKVLTVWVKITAITSAGQKLHFPEGMKKTRDRAIYDHNRSGVC